MYFTALKNPVVLAILVGSVIVTNVVTYNVSSPSADYCGPAVEQALAENQERLAEDDADLQRALRPVDGLNPNRSGGLNWNESIR